MSLSLQIVPDDHLCAFSLLTVRLQTLQDAVRLGAAVQSLQNLSFPVGRHTVTASTQTTRVFMRQPCAAVLPVEAFCFV